MSDSLPFSSCERYQYQPTILFCFLLHIDATSAVKGATDTKPNEPTNVISTSLDTYFRLRMSMTGVPCPAKYISSER